MYSFTAMTRHCSINIADRNIYLSTLQYTLYFREKKDPKYQLHHMHSAKLYMANALNPRQVQRVRMFTISELNT